MWHLYTVSGKGFCPKNILKIELLTNQSGPNPNTHGDMG